MISLAIDFAENFNGCPLVSLFWEKMKKYFISSGKHIIAVESTQSKDNIIAHKFAILDEERHIADLGEFTWNNKTKVEILSASVVQENLTGRKIPVVLVQPIGNRSRTSRIDCFILIIDLQKDNFVPLRKCELHFKDLDIQTENNVFGNKLCLVDGPGLIICTSSKVIMFYNEIGTTLNRFSFDFKRQGDLCDCCCKMALQAVNQSSFLNIKNCCDRFIMFMSLKIEVVCDKHQSSFKNCTQVLQFHRNRFTLLDVSMFFPKEYSECLTSISFQEVITQGEKTTYEMFLGTTEGYILHARNGILLNCASIFDQQPVTYIYVTLSCTSNFLVGSSDRYAVLSNKLQLVEEHTGYEQLFVGDFRCNGSEQFLLLKGDPALDTQWIVTDLKTKTLSSADNEKKKRGTECSSSSIAVSALKTRLQREEVSLHEEEIQLAKMTDYISDMFTRQVSLAAGLTPKPHTHQTDLTCLVPGSGDGRVHLDGGWQQECSLTLQSCDIWQKMLQDRWCVGVDISCQTKRSVKLWLDLVPAGSNAGIMSMKSSVLTYKHTDGGKPDVTSMTSVKRARLSPDCISVNQPVEFFIEKANQDPVMCAENKTLTGSVFSVLALPPFSNSDHFCVNVILNWTFSGIDSPTESNVADLHQEYPQRSRTADNVRVYTRCCGEITLYAKDVLEGRHELDFSVKPVTADVEMEDIKELRRCQLAWQHIQTLHQLVLKAPPGILARFETQLTSRCGFECNEQHNCYVTSMRTLRDIQVQLGAHTRDDYRQLDVYARSEKDLFLLVHHLYSHLPDCALILPKETSSAESAKLCQSALQTEAHFLSHGLRQLLEEHDAANASTDSDDTDDVCDMRKVGEKFKHKREKFQKKQNDMLDSEKVKKFIEQCRGIQALTDNTLLSAATKHSNVL